MELQVINIEG